MYKSVCHKIEHRTEHPNQQTTVKMSSTNRASLPESLGFIGLGAMGKPMVINLANEIPLGSRIHVHDVVTAAMDELQELFPEKIIKCASAREVTEKSVCYVKHWNHHPSTFHFLTRCFVKDVIFTMLPEGVHVKSVYLDPDNGILAALSSPPSPSSTTPSSLPGKLLIDSSTIDTATNLHVKQHLATSSPKTAFYDAPVSGGVLGAVNASIAFFLGCSASDPNVPRLTSLLRTMGAKVIPCGGPSLGLAAKLSNNYLSGIITIACAEAMDMGMRAGIDAHVLASVFAAGTAQNTICDVFNPVPGVCPRAPPSNGYRDGFRVELMRKDVGLALGMARTVGAKNILGASGLGVYAAASEAADCKGLDSRVVYRYLGGSEHWKAGE